MSLLNPRSGKVTLPGPVTLAHGGILPEVEVSYSVYGDLDSGQGVALFFHGLSSDSRLASWWTKFPLEELLDKLTIVSVNCLGSCHGTTGPMSIDPSTSFQYLGEFPRLSISDTVDVAVRALEALGVQGLDLALGCSLGGMQALDLFLRYPSLCRRVVSVCGAPLELQSRLETDAHLRIVRDGIRAGLPMNELEQRLAYSRFLFRLSCTTPDALAELEAKQGSYERTLEYFLSDSERFRSQFSPYSYLAIMDAVTTFSIQESDVETAAGRGASASLEIVGIQGDRFTPAPSVRELASQLSAKFPHVAYSEFDTLYGHEAWILDGGRFYEFMKGKLRAD